jgi:transcriptional regulator with XRE-family HTH domain
MDYVVLGKRIYKLRTEKGLSQAEVADAVTISRSDLSKIENGLRKMPVETLVKLSTVLEISVDDLVESKYRVTEPVIKYKSKKAAVKKTEGRKATPTLKISKFQQVLLYLLERCSGKPNVGETVLNKLIYFIEFNYYERYEEHLIGATFRKLPFGPVPDGLGQIISEMQKKGLIKIIKTEYHNYHQKRFIPLLKPNLTKITAAEIEVIDHVINQLSDLSAKSISDYSHEDMPWKATKAGDVIDYELAFYREPPFSARIYDNDDAE